jgi:hypothetical protein
MRLPSFALAVVLLCSSTCIAFEAVGDAAPLQERSDEPSEAKTPKKTPPSDAQIKQLLIDESIAAYSGNCPCPYNTARNGSRCGRRSAYSREGGEAPLCYPKDVSAEMVQSYRDQHPQE